MSKSLQTIRVAGGIDDNSINTIKAAETVPQLASLVAANFRPTFTALLHAHHSTWRKYYSAKGYVEKLEAHLAKGTFPSEIGGAIAPPTVQFSKEFAGSAASQAFSGELTQLVKKTRTEALTMAIKAKRQEMSDLRASASPAASHEAVLKIGEEAARTSLGILEEGSVKLSPISVERASSGEVRTKSATVSGLAEPEAGEMLFFLNHGPTILRRVAILAENAHNARSASKRQAIEKVARATNDVVMGNTEEENGASIKKLIDNALSSFAQKHKIGTGPKGQKSKLSTSVVPYRLSNIHTRTEEVRRPFRRPEEGLRAETKTNAQGQRQGKLREGWEGTGGKGEKLGEEEGLAKVSRLALRRKCCSEDGFYHVCEGEMRWPHPPPSLLCTAARNDELFAVLPLSVVKKWVIQALPHELVEYTPEIGAGIFMQPGVTLPADVEFSIAHNGKFIFHQEPKPQLIREAYIQFENTLRWRFHHQDKPDKPFLSRFHVKSGKSAPGTTIGFERGILRGRNLTRRNVESVLPLKKLKLFNPNMSRVRTVLRDQSLLVLNTDKNLGIAVVQVQWYRERAQALIGDTSTYKKIDHLIMLQHMRTAKNKIKLAIRDAGLWSLTESDWERPILVKYLKHSIDREDVKVPEFKGLPKVHKLPWTLRPIIPSHSWITSGASQVVDHLLQPILNTMPWVVTSTIQVVRDLSKIKVNRNENVWLISGDVQSFYTNVPIQETFMIIMDMAEALGYPPWKVLMLSVLLEAIMNNNCCRYMGDYYLQRMGIAMGTSCAPQFANLYAAKYEQNAEWRMDKNLRYFCRYIDDMLFVFVGTAAQRDTFLSKVKLGALTLTWEIRNASAGESLSYLDLELFFSKRPLEWGLQSRLFKKKLNRHMYIPYSSAHPDSVKKSFIKAELTRFMYLSSKKEYFEESKNSFYINLRKRGYPAEILDQWFTQVNYTTRASVLHLGGNKSTKRDIPLIVPSEYNPVWNYVNLHEVYGEIQRTWQREGVTLGDAFRSAPILSLRRTENLMDKVTVWNKNLLNSQQLSAAARSANRDVKRSYLTAFPLLERSAERSRQRIRAEPRHRGGESHMPAVASGRTREKDIRKYFVRDTTASRQRSQSPPATQHKSLDVSSYRMRSRSPTASRYHAAAWNREFHDAQ